MCGVEVTRRRQIGPRLVGWCWTLAAIGYKVDDIVIVRSRSGLVIAARRCNCTKNLIMWRSSSVVAVWFHRSYGHHCYRRWPTLIFICGGTCNRMYGRIAQAGIRINITPCRNVKQEAEKCAATTFIVCPPAQEEWIRVLEEGACLFQKRCGCTFLVSWRLHII